jgi:hypothetical protein
MEKTAKLIAWACVIPFTVYLTAVGLAVLPKSVYKTVKTNGDFDEIYREDLKKTFRKMPLLGKKN